MEMVEKVARAIAPHWFDGGPFSANNSPNVRALALNIARDAIEAMREPTKAMLDEIATEPVHLYDEGNRDADYRERMKAATTADRLSAAIKWARMIDAALRDSGSDPQGEKP